MGKKIILSIWILSISIIGTVYSNDKLKNVQIHQAGDGLIFYIESEYELDNSAYVSDELPTVNVYSVKIEDRILKVYFMPHGNKIKIGDESTNYPPLVRLIQNGNKLAFTMDFNILIAKENLSLENIDSIEIIILDTIFYTDRELYQCYLTKQELYTLKYIYSDVIKINKSDYEVYWENNKS